LKRLGVATFDRIMVTGLLTEGGEPGSRVIGALGVSVHTGEFYIFRSKATIVATAKPTGLWVFNTELRAAGALQEPNHTSEAFAMMWNAGVEFTMMEASSTNMQSGGFGNLPYSAGNAHNTWYACTLVDADGREIPWVDRNGKVLKTVEERYHCASGQRAFVYDGPRFAPDLPERIRAGEFKLPLYADLPGMPEHERRAIWGLMIGNEGKTLVPVYEELQRWGFDPDKDMLQAPVQPPDVYTWGAWWKGYGPRQYRGLAGAGPVFDWDFRTNLEGLYVAGSTIASGANHSGSATTGRYAGRKAAEYARSVEPLSLNRSQVDEGKIRVYESVNRTEGMGWKELKAGLTRIMQDYCGEYKNEEALRMGLKWLATMKESELSSGYARNPHELGRTLEAAAQATVSEAVIHACLARKASSKRLAFNRLDCPRIDPPEWNKFITIRMEKGKVKTGDLPLDYWLLPPYGPTYDENYRKHCGL
jgi:succinate dehydrogenase/fumarate reductase flavoprotein subunit